jgi:hypothetical protein
MGGGIFDFVEKFKKPDQMQYKFFGIIYIYQY